MTAPKNPPCQTLPPADLVELLAQAAAEAVRARRGAIEQGGANLNGIVIEIELANRGAVLDTTSHLTWRQLVRGATR